MSNHLGNVQAVVSDKRNEDSVTHAYTAGLQGAFDYYPYGMPMRGRHFYNWLSTGSLPEVRTVWVSPSKMVPLLPVYQGWQGCQCNFFPMGQDQMMISASEGPPCNGQLPYVMGWGGVWQDVPVQSNGLPEEIQLQFSSNEIPAVYIEEDMGGGNYQLLASSPATQSPGGPFKQQYNFTPTAGGSVVRLTLALDNDQAVIVDSVLYKVTGQPVAQQILAWIISMDMRRTGMASTDKTR